MSTYPSIAAGQSITAGLLTSMLPNVVVKQAHTDRASTTALTADPELSAPLAANAVYQVEFDLLAGAIALADIQTRWSVPAAASGLKSLTGPGSTAANSNADNITTRMGVHAFSLAIAYNGVRDSQTNLFRIYEYGIVTTTSAGSIALEWAQNTSQTTATRVAAGSVLRVRRIG